MKSKSTKLSVFILNNNIDGELNWTVTPSNYELFTSEDKSRYIYTFDHDLSSRSKVEVKLLSKNGVESHIKIEKVMIDDCELKNFEKWTILLDADNKRINNTYGWMGFSSTYILNIHYSPISQNYISYFLSKCE